MGPELSSDADSYALLQAGLDHIDQGFSVFDRHPRLVGWNRKFLELLDFPDWIGYRDSLPGLKGGNERSPFDRSIDVRISRLRQKIEKDPKNPQIIKTVYGTGYMFAARVEWVAKAG